MSKKQNVKKKSKADIAISQEEADELQMIIDRLAVQNPEGETFDGFLQSLRDSLQERPHMAITLVEKLSRNPSKAGFRTFRTFEPIIEESSYKRYLRQAAYRFSQRGFAEAVSDASPEKVVLIQTETKNPVAHFFLVPGTLWLVSSLVPESGPAHYHLVTAFLEDDYGSFNVRVAEGNQKFYKDYLRRIAQHAGTKGVEIPVRHAARLFFEMLDFCTGKRTDRELEQGRDIFGRFFEPDRKPYVYELMMEVDEPERYLPEIDIAELLEGMDLSWLKFSKEELSEFHEKLNALDSPVLVVSREIQIERSETQIRSACESLCTGKKRHLFRRYFEEQAMALKLSSDEKKANWAWLIAQHLAGESSAGENPVVFQVLMYSLKYYWPDDFKPGKAQPEASPERRTESGIILP